MINREILNLILITSLPIAELRGSIPLGITAYNLPWQLVFFVCVITNIIIGILIFLFFRYLVKIVNFISFLKKPYERFVIRTQNKISSAVEKYGVIGLALFIAVPLPGTGVYTGAIGANLLGIKFKDFIIADVIGVLIAGIIVTIISTGVVSLWHIFI